MTALTYIGVLIVLALVFAISRTDKHEATDDVDVFRYPKTILWAVFSGAPIFLIGGVVVFSTWGPHSSAVSFYVFLGVWVVIVCSFVAASISYMAFRIEITATNLRVIKFYLRNETPISRISRIVLVEGGKGGQELSVYDLSNKLLLKVGDSIQDFNGLVSVISTRTAGQERRFEQRDKWGKWRDA